MKLSIKDLLKEISYSDDPEEDGGIPKEVVKARNPAVEMGINRHDTSRKSLEYSTVELRADGARIGRVILFGSIIVTINHHDMTGEYGAAVDAYNPRTWGRIMLHVGKGGEQSYAEMEISPQDFKNLLKNPRVKVVSKQRDVSDPGLRKPKRNSNILDREEDEKKNG